MSAQPQIKKPTLAWVIVGFTVTLVLFIYRMDDIEEVWYLFVLFIIMDIAALIQYFDRKKVYEKMLKEAEGLSESGNHFIVNLPLAKPATIKVVRDSSFVGCLVPYQVYLNNEFAGKIKNGKTLELSTSVSHNIVRVFDNQDNPFKGNFVVDLEEGGYAEVHVKAGRFLTQPASAQPVNKHLRDDAAKHEGAPSEELPLPAHGHKKSSARETVPLFEGGKKPFYILEHKESSVYHKAGEKQKIIADQVEIGRDPNCEVRYDDHFETVSRRHAAIIREGSHWKLAPLSQTNPSFINGRRVHQEWYLQDNDEIQCSVNGPILIFRTI